MKLPLFFLLAATAIADVPIDQNEAQSIKSIDAQEARDSAAKLDGKLVRIRFNYRSVSVEVKPDGTAAAKLRIYRSRAAVMNDARGFRFGGVDAVFPAEGVNWVQNLTTHDESKAPLYVIARLHNVNGTAEAEVLGRQVVTDSKGSRVTW